MKYLITISTILCVYLMMDAWFEKRKIFEKRLTVTLSLFIWEMINMFIWNTLSNDLDYRIVVFLMLTSFIFSMIIFSSNVFKTALLISTISVTILSSSLLAEHIFMHLHIEYHTGGFLSINSLCYGQIFATVLSIMMTFFSKKRKIYCSIALWIVLILVMAVTVFIHLYIFTNVDLSPNNTDSSSYMLMAAEPLIIIVLFYIMLFLFSKKQQELLNIKEMEKNHDIEMQRFSHLNSMYKQQQKRVHEYRHELNYLSTLLTEKAYDRASNYVYGLTMKSNKEDNVINTGSLVIDSILNDMYHSGIRAGIQFILKLDDLSKVNIPDEDLVVSISNLVQNALQAEIHEPVKEIKLYCQDKTGCLMFSIQNRISENDHQPGNGLNINHGYGLLNAREVADRYNGSFTTGINNGWYESSIIIPYQSPASV